MELSLLPQQTVTLVSPSRIQEFHNCPKSHFYKYVRLLTAKGEVKGYFNKGNYVHELLHVYYELIRAGTAPGSPFAVEFIKDRIASDLDLYIQTSEGNRSLIPVFSIVSTRVVRYIQEQSRKIDGGMQVKGVEHELIWPINETTVFRGFADLIYRDRSGILRVRDHKSGEQAWSTADAACSEQLIDYATVIFKHTGEVPLGEINYINTKVYAKGHEPTFQQAFTYNVVKFSKKELEYHYAVLSVKISEMLSSSPVPHYDQRCIYCPYQGPCFAERKGIDSTPIIEGNFIIKPREGLRNHASFTEAYSTRNDFD